MTTKDRAREIPLERSGLSQQLRPVTLLVAAQVAGMALFTVVVPRLMGPELFGRFAVILSLSTLWMTSSTLGGSYVFGRFVPEYGSAGRPDRIRAVFMHVFLLRLAVLVVATPLFWLALAELLPDASRTVLTLSTVGFVALTTASPMFAAQYGLNRLGISMSKEALGRYLLIALIVVAGGATRLERATLALALTNLLILAAGFVLARGLFTLGDGALDLRQLFFHIRFGVAIAAANLLLRLPWRLGEAALAYFDTRAAEIAFFNIALSIVVGATRVFGILTNLLIPSMGLKQASGDRRGRDESLGLALRYLLVVACLVVLGVQMLGPWAVETFLGHQYLEVVPNLSIVSLAILFVPIVRSSISLAVVEDRVRFVLRLGVVAVAVFLTAVALLVPRLASHGGSIAVVLAVGIAATLALVEMRRSEVATIARLPRQALAAGAAAGLFFALGSAPVSAVAAAALYLVLVPLLGITNPAEIRDLLHSARRDQAQPPSDTG